MSESLPCDIGVLDISFWDQGRANLAGELLKIILMDRKDVPVDDLPRLAALANEAATVIFPFSAFPPTKGSAEDS